MERRLAAIMAADVVGYSKMMGANEAATLAAFGELRHDVFEPMVASHRGKVVKRMGDGWLVEFASSLDAVECAIAIQEKRRDHETIKLRIGIHIGDVVHDDEGDIHGDGVNIAARLEGVAEPSGIAISDQVYSSLDGTMTPAFSDGGECELKNIARRIRVWNWPSVLVKEESVARAEQDATPVILLETFSIGGDMEAATDLALELQSGLLDSLSHRSGIRVSTPAEGGDPPTYLLKGRCRVSGDRCRLHLSVAVAAKGETLWTTRIDEKIEDVFDFVDEVVGSVSAAIRVHINTNVGAVYVTQPDVGLNLQQLLAKAAFCFNQFDARHSAISRKTMAVALAKASDNPMVLAMHSFALMQTVPLAIERVDDIDVEAVESFANKAVQQGSNVDWVFHNRARIRLWLRQDHDGCIKDATRALAINPVFHLANEDLALADIFGGNPSRGVEKLESIIRQAPTELTTPNRLSLLGIGYALAGDMVSATRHALDAYERTPLEPLSALAYAAAVSWDDDIVQSTEFRDMVEHHDLKVSDSTRFPFSRHEDTAVLAEMLQRSGLPN